MQSKELYLRLLKHTLPYWRIFLLAIVSMVIYALTEPAIPALLKPLLDGSFVNKDQDTLFWAPIVLLAIFAIRGLTGFGSTVCLNWVAFHLVKDLRQKSFHKLVTLPNSFYDENPSGILISKLSFDVNQVTSAATETLLVLIRDSLTVLGLLAWMIYLNWKLSLIALAVVPVIAISVKLVSKRLRKFSHSLQKSMGEMTHILEETISGNRVMKVFGGQKYECQRFKDSIEQIRSHNTRLTIASMANVEGVQMITVFALATIIYFASLQSMQNAISVGEFVSFFTAMGLLFSPIKRLTKINERLQQGLAAAESVFTLIDQQSETDTGHKTLLKPSGHLQFRDVNFCYQGSEKPALRDINFTVQAGQSIALVGSSGSGKTTLVSLIPRFYPLTTGEILLDGQNTDKLTLENLRTHVSLVSQDIVLFNDSIRANIAYGSMNDASEEDIIAAATAAHAMEFIQPLRDGLNTLIGENGAKLSGGQRQRLAIARAILKNAPILILDEATSALDTQSERYIQAALEELKKNRTTFIIAHRLSTIEAADQILVMDQGQLVERGTHQDFLATNGVYAQLHRIQFNA